MKGNIGENTKFKKKIKVVFFFNNMRGFETVKFFSKKKNFEISRIYLAKKNLNMKIISNLKKFPIEIIQNLKKPDIFKYIRKNKIDFNLICGFPYIFDNKLINSPKYKTINMHAGRLPHYRGGSPLNWQIINGEKFIYLSLLDINKNLDTGEIILEKKFRLKNSYDIKKVHNIANNLFPKMAFQALSKIIKNSNLKFKKQNNIHAKYFYQRKESDGKIIWNNKAKKIYNLIRAITLPYPCAFTFDNKKNKIKILKAKLTNFKLKKGEKIGKIIFTKKKIFVNCLDKKIELIKTSPKIKNSKYLN